VVPASPLSPKEFQPFKILNGHGWWEIAFTISGRRSRRSRHEAAGVLVRHCLEGSSVNLEERMSDQQCTENLVNYASDATRLQAIQHTAAAKLLAYDEEIYPADGCAITLSLLLQAVGIDVPDTYMAFDLAKELEQNRGWTRLTVGAQKAGDVGTTCLQASVHGSDHIYFVLKAVNQDEMVIADNQMAVPHFRFASGQGKTPTQYFLRAPG